MRKGNPAFSEMYLKALTARARDVIQTSQPIAAVNAARMLARLAETGTDEAGDACLEAGFREIRFAPPPRRQSAQRALNHRAATMRSCVAAEIIMFRKLPPTTCGVVCTSILPLNDPGSAVPAICRHTAIGMITDSIL